MNLHFSKIRRRRGALIVVAFLLIGVAAVLVVGHNRATLTIDRNQPFWIEFGRGSGWHGLDTVKLDQTGRIVLHRLQRINAAWEVTTLQLPPEAVAEVLLSVESNKLMSLDNEYHDENIHDGTQWVLWVRQGEHEKSIYFNNQFPSEIKAFAKELDAILLKAGSDKAEWKSVPTWESRQHEKELWESIRR